MPVAAIGIGLGTALAGGAAAGATVYGAHKQSSAANRAAKLSTDAANHAADVEGASSREALDFQKQEAQRAAGQAEADRKANYDQWAAFMTSHNAARAKYGYSTTAVPGYEPGAVPKYTNSPGAALMGQGGPARPLASNPNTGVIDRRSVGSLLMPPSSGPVPGSVTEDPLLGRPARPAPRSIGASLYGGR